MTKEEKELIEAMKNLKAAWLQLMDVCMDADIDANDYICDEFPFGAALEDMDVTGWCDRTEAAVIKAAATRSKTAVAKAREAIAETYIKLSEMEKPDSYRVGGTYYGSRELFSQVGNMLELMKDGTYSKYNYGGVYSDYKNIYAIKIGGAYKVSEITGRLNETLKELLPDTGYMLIDDYGTNFSVIGMGQRA